MKIRNGFVSNSSSSSFVLFFKKMPKDVKELQQMLFGDAGYYSSPYDRDQWTTDQVAAQVFKDIQRCIINEDALGAKAAEWATSTNDPHCPDYPHYRHIPEEGDKQLLDWLDTMRWHQYNKAIEKFGDKKAKELKEKYKGYTIVEVEYSDNDGALGAAMEHGSLFDRIEHLKISHH